MAAERPDTTRPRRLSTAAKRKLRQPLAPEHISARETGDGPVTLYHKTVYTFASLQALLEANGFGDIRRYDWQQTIHKDHDDHSQAYFPHMDKENGILVSLNVEATKQ